MSLRRLAPDDEQSLVDLERPPQMEYIRDQSGSQTDVIRFTRGSGPKKPLPDCNVFPAMAAGDNTQESLLNLASVTNSPSVEI